MSPVNPYVVSQLRQLVYYHLDCNLLRNALFLAGRLHAYEPRSSEAAYLLALCHLRLGQLKAAFDSSRIAGSRGNHFGCSYVYAQACLGLDKYLEGITATDRCKSVWSTRNNWNKHTDTRRQQLPDAAAFHCLQGKLWHAHHDTTKAIECYAEALKLNPFMWDAFLGLCDLGVNIRVGNIFKMTPDMMLAISNPSTDEKSPGLPEEGQPTSTQSQTNSSNHTQPPSSNDPFSISKNRINGEVRLNIGSSALFEKFNGSKSTVAPMGGVGGIGFDTPTGHGGLSTELLSAKELSGAAVAIPGSLEPPPAPIRKARTLQALGLDFSVDAPPRMQSNLARSKSRSKGDSEDTEGTALSRTSTLSNAAGERKRTVSGQPPPHLVSTGSTTNTSSSLNDPIRRSVRLFNQIRPQNGKFSSTGSLGAKEGRELKKVKATGTKGRSANTYVGRVVSGNRKYGDPMEIDGKEGRPISNTQSSAPTANTKTGLSDKVKECEGLQWLLELFFKFGSGYFALKHYQCRDALSIFNSVTPSQRDTPWVLAQIGRALYEQAAYADAAKVFSRIKTMAPAILDDMELYSSTLWLLKDEIKLTFLAHEIIATDRDSPQAWCAVGNTFSLQRDHERALKCFKRAIQLDPKFAYAYSLQGHEHIVNEEYDKALVAFRGSIMADNRAYQAWYGLGQVFEKQGKYDFAIQHYRTACKINPTNAVIILCIGSVLEKQRNLKGALAQYSRSVELAPTSQLARFKKAKVLMSLREPDQALSELRILKDIVPDEACVHFELGKVYKFLQQKGNAIKHFTTALNLDPKASHLIKEAMESIEEEYDADVSLT